MRDWLPVKITLWGKEATILGNFLRFYNGGSLTIDAGKPTGPIVWETLAQTCVSEACEEERIAGANLHMFNCGPIRGYEMLPGLCKNRPRSAQNFFLAGLHLLFFARRRELSQQIWERTPGFFLAFEKNCGGRDLVRPPGLGRNRKLSVLLYPGGLKGATSSRLPGDCLCAGCRG